LAFRLSGAPRYLLAKRLKFAGCEQFGHWLHSGSWRPSTGGLGFPNPRNIVS
jgi:hypothetical protein